MIVFILKLKNGNYFIGNTHKKTFSFSEFNSTNIEWTKKYKPIEIVDILENCSFNYYVKVINIYKDFYGIKSVYFGDEFNIDCYNEEMNNTTRQKSNNYNHLQLNSFDDFEYRL